MRPTLAPAAYNQPAIDPYAPQFEPYADPATGQRAPAADYRHSPQQPAPSLGFGRGAGQGNGPVQTAAPNAHWPQTPQGLDGNGYPLPRQAGRPTPHDPYAATGFGHPGDAGPSQAQPDWPTQPPRHAYGHVTQPAHQPAQPPPAYAADGYPAQGLNDFGFAEPAGGELEPGLHDEDDYDYDVEPAPRRGGIAKIAAALVGAIVIGGGMAYGYRAIVGDSGSGEPPLVKSATAPEKVKPIDAGGKQFAHSDSKIMSRLGDGAAATAGSATGAAASDLDSGGTRKVSTLVVGRDGSIQPPPISEPVTVPGLTVVDAFGNSGTAVTVPPPLAPPAAPKVVNAEPSRVVVEPPAAPAAVPPPKTTASLSDAVTAAPAEPAAPVKVAARDPAPAPAPPPAVNGYVAVLASLPRSSSSRMDALARFADMQQKYSSVLSGKVPDVAEANLGAKGNYHRLVVGPPASRQQASALCADLKRAGYSECWVTGY